VTRAVIACEIEHRPVARDDHLGRVIIVGDGADLALRRGIGQRLRLFDIRAQQRRHRAFADRDSRLHRLPAQFQQARRRGEIERFRPAQRRIFAQRVPGDIIALIGQAKPALLFQYAQRRDGIRHDRRLRVLGQCQITLWPVAHDTEQMLAQRLVDFLKHMFRMAARLRQRLAHADRLAALPRKDECAHDDPLIMFAARSLTICEPVGSPLPFSRISAIGPPSRAARRT
jgi:hypothetical protein